MAQVGDKTITVNIRALAMASVLDEKGDKVLAHTLWDKQPAILIFLRHFACDQCRVHALDVWRNRELYESKGAKIHFIGNGSPYFIGEFKKQYGLEGASFFTDPSLKIFAAAGFRKGFWIDPGEAFTRAQYLTAAVKQQLRRTGEGSVWQLGGVVAIKPGGKVTYQYTSQMLGDFPPANDVPK